MKPIAWAALSIAMMAPVALGAQAVEKAENAPATRQDASEQRIKKLIAQLGDEEFKARDAAAEELRKLGKPALPALRQAIKSEDPTIRSYAEYLLKEAGEMDRPDPDKQQEGAPAENRRSNKEDADRDRQLDVDRQERREIRRQRSVTNSRVSISIVNGTKKIDAVEDDRQVRILEDDSGIQMRVSEPVDGKPVAKEYRAKSADELKKEHPEAFEIYKRYAQSGALRAEIRIGELPRGRFVGPPPAALRQLEQNMRRAGIPAEERRRILQQLGMEDEVEEREPRAKRNEDVDDLLDEPAPRKRQK